MDITTASRELLVGLIGTSGAELIVQNDGSIQIDISMVKDNIIDLSEDNVHTLMVDLAVALRLAENL